MPAERNRVRRRRVLRTAPGVAAVLAGCGGVLSDDGSPSRGSETPTRGDPNTTASPTEGNPGEKPVRLLTDFETDGWERHWMDLADSYDAETGTALDVTYRSSEHDIVDDAQDEDLPDLYTSTRSRATTVGGPLPREPVSDLVGAAESTAGSPLVDPLVHRGEPVQFPHSLQAATLQYRADVYADLGLSVPTSFQALRGNAQAIAESDWSLRGYGLGGHPGGRGAGDLHAFLARAGVSPVGLRWRDPDRRAELEVHFPEEPVTAVLALLRDLAEYSPAPTSDPAGGQKRWLRGGIGQRFGYNNAVAGYAARRDSLPWEDGERPANVVATTDVAPLPYWRAGNVDRSDSWAFRPRIEGHTLFASGPNTPGARRLLRWLYADDADRAASLYRHAPTRGLPVYDVVRESDVFRSQSHFQAHPDLLEGIDRIATELVPEHYGNVAEADLADPVAVRVGSSRAFTGMVDRVVSGDATVAEAYSWGRDRLERALAEARETFR